MRQISVPYLFVAASLLEKLLLLEAADTPLEEMLMTLVGAHQQMVALHAPESLYAPSLRSAYQSAEFLAEAIKRQTDDLTPGRIVSGSDIADIKRSYDQYRAALLGAFSTMGSYLVTQKGSYDVLTLLFEGEKLFPADLQDKVPEAVFDAQETGKCLAFDVTTACGFHAFRVVEAVVRRYWTFETGGAAAPKVRSLGVYINAFNEKK